MSSNVSAGNSKNPIIDVWEHNLEQEFDNISRLIDRYNYVAMDTEFPGIYYQGDQYTGYNFIKENVDNLRLIQVGLTLSTGIGDEPSPHSTWQFNLKFDLE